MDFSLKDSFEREEKFSKEKKKIIDNKMSKCICKIKNKDKNITGFFCNVNFPDLTDFLPVLISDSCLFEENSELIDKEIEFYIEENKFFKIVIEENRKVYVDKKNNIAIIEIKNIDGLDLNSFLFFDDINPNEIYTEKPIYLIHFDENDKNLNSFNKIKNIEKDRLNYFTSINDMNLLNCPIINFVNNKIIGINKRKEIEGKILNFGIINEYAKLFIENKNIII